MIAVSRVALRIAIVLLPAAVACHWGTRKENFAPALSPAGARVAIRVRGEPGERVGELYAVDSAGIIIRAARLTRIHWPVLSAMDVDGLGRGYDVGFNTTTVGSDHRDRLASVSRFPQGLSGELLTRVLTRLGQDAVEEVR